MSGVDLTAVLRPQMRPLTRAIGLAAGLLLLALQLGCGPEKPEYSPGSSAAPGSQQSGSGNGSGSGSGNNSGNQKPGGGDQNSGDGDNSGGWETPTGDCGGDDDGQYGQSRLVISELAYGQGGYIELRATAIGVESEIELERVHIEGTLHKSFSTGNLKINEQMLVTTSSLPSVGELAVFIDDELVEYLCWGGFSEEENESSLSPLQQQAVSQGLWLNLGVCAEQPRMGWSLHLVGGGLYGDDYVEGPRSPLGCEEE